MKIVDFVRPELVIPELKASTKGEILAELAGHLAANAPGLDRDVLGKALAERERLASTAIDQGVAIPHAKLRALPALVACVGRKREGIDFESMDGRPTHLFFVLVAPENSTGVHLKALARISRLFRDPGFRQRLMDAADAAELYRVIADEDAKY
jgi:PTS system nitrogen regulatory IIA component